MKDRTICNGNMERYFVILQAEQGYDVSFVVGNDEVACQTVMQLAKALCSTPVDWEKLRNAQILEKMTDFIRFIIIGQKFVFYATISVHRLTAAKKSRWVGQKPSNLNPRNSTPSQKFNNNLLCKATKMFKEWNLNDWMNNGLFFLTVLMLIFSFVFF